MDIIAEQDYVDHADAVPEKSSGKFGDTREVEWNGGIDAWTISPEAMWINDTPMTFYAYTQTTNNTCDITEPTVGASGFSFSYPKTSVEPDGQTDILMARSRQTHSSTGSDNDNLTLAFQHAMSKICFDPTVTLPANVSLKGIRIMNLFTSGSATFNGATYSWDEGTLTGESDFRIDDTDASPQSKCFLVIPQNAYSQHGLIELTLKQDGSGDIVTLSRSLADYTMQQGKMYVYRLTVTDLNTIAFTVSEQDWDQVDGGEMNPNAPQS